MTARTQKHFLIGPAILLVGGLLGLLAHPETLANPAGQLVPTENPMAQPYKPALIGVAEARRHFEMGTAIFIDTRLPDAFKKEHIPGALALTKVPFQPLWREIRALVPNGATVICVGENAVDLNVARWASQLRMFGIAETRYLDGGLDQWKKSGLPIVSGWDMDDVLREAVR